MQPGLSKRPGDLPRPEHTLAILLGASEYPRCGDTTLNSPKFKESAKRFRKYLETRLRLPPHHIKDLFDHDEDPNTICQTITTFLHETRPNAIADVVLYYVGHGDCTENTYCLFLRRTHKDKLLNTALPAPQLKEALGGDQLHWRLHFVVDACFSGRAVDVYQSGDGNSVSELLLKSLPEKGISFLCSSNRDHRSLAPADADVTMFSGALLDILENHGDEAAGPRLSAQQVCELTRQLIARRYPDRARWPEIFPLRHREKDMPVTEVPFTPTRPAHSRMSLGRCAICGTRKNWA
jgi:hypothetical protein